MQNSEIFRDLPTHFAYKPGKYFPGEIQVQEFDAIVIGAGAAGLMCAATAGQKGRRILLLDHAKKAGEKIRISGGGRCNFTNMHAAPTDFLSANPHFCKSALKRYTQWDFVDLVAKYGIAYHEKTLGQLFCDDSSQQIIDMMLSECRKGDVSLKLNSVVDQITFDNGIYYLKTNQGGFKAAHLVIATGGKSIPKMGATGFGYDIARQFNIPVTDTCAALVPLRFGEDILEEIQGFSGLSVNATVSSWQDNFPGRASLHPSRLIRPFNPSDFVLLESRRRDYRGSGTGPGQFSVDETGQGRKPKTICTDCIGGNPAQKTSSKMGRIDGLYRPPG